MRHLGVASFPAAGLEEWCHEYRIRVPGSASRIRCGRAGVSQRIATGSAAVAHPCAVTRAIRISHRQRLLSVCAVANPAEIDRELGVQRQLATRLT